MNESQVEILLSGEEIF